MGHWGSYWPEIPLSSVGSPSILFHPLWKASMPLDALTVSRATTCQHANDHVGRVS